MHKKLIFVLVFIIFSLAYIPAVKAAVCVQPPSGLVGWWPGDGNANDIWDGNSGTLMNGVTFAPGKVGQAFSFDGVDDYVEVPYDPSFNLSSFTLEAWVKFTQNDTNARIISHPNDGNPTDGYSFFTLSNALGKIGGGVQGEGQNYSASVSTVSFTFADDNWHMVNFVRDIEADEISIYVDGILYVSLPGSSPGDMDHNFKGIIIGSTDGTKDFFEGLIDEVEIYNRALNASEIQAIYNADSAGKCKADSDADGDGYTSDIDCNDNDASVYPGAVEVCDGVDNDCDGILEEDYACGSGLGYSRTSTTLRSDHTESTKPGDMITLSGVVTPDRGARYPLIVSVQHPDGTYAFNDVLWTDDHGNYQFQVTVMQRGYMRAEVRSQNDMSSKGGFYRASGSEIIIPVLPEIGMVIVVAGGGEESILFPMTEYLSDTAVKTFQGRNVPDDPSIPERNRIMYLHPNISHDVFWYGNEPSVDAEPTLANLEWAIETWAAELIQVKDDAGNWWPEGVFETPLTVYLIGDIAAGQFFINGIETIDGPTLDAYLDTLEQSIIDQFTAAGVTPPSYLPINVIIEGPSSGDFIIPLSQQGRVILTSTESATLCDSVAVPSCGTSYMASGGSVSFSAYFLSRIASGHYIHPSFAYSQLNILSNPGLVGQKPQIEATGNGISNEIADEIKTASMPLEYRPISDARPQMQNGLGQITLRDIHALMLWVYVDDPENTLTAVEAMIIPPEESFEETDVIQFVRNPSINNRWEAVYGSFSGEGIYTVVYTATDDAGNVAYPLVKSVTVIDTIPPLDVTGLGILTPMDWPFLSPYKLRWYPSESLDAQGYKIYVTPPDGEEFLWSDVGNVDHVSLTSLVTPLAIGTYIFRVTAYDRVPLESYGISVSYNSVSCFDPDSDGFGNLVTLLTDLLNCLGSTTQTDNCPSDFNPDQLDTDSDFIGDVCDICPADATDTCDATESASINLGIGGGTLITDSGNALLTIPSGSLTTDTSISVSGSNEIPTTNISSFEAQTGTKATSLIYTFEPEGTVFSEPATITLQYNDTGIDERTIDFYLFNSTSQQWESQDAFGGFRTCDTVLNNCTLTVDHFSDYIVGAFADADGDGYSIDTDCDDTNPEINPSAKEICDSIDNNCDGIIDDVDEDQDLVNDCFDDKCLDSLYWEAEQELKPNHYDSINWPASDTNFGCSCEQVLYCKPGSNNGEFKFGCSQGTKDIWEAQSEDSWALECQIDGIVAMEGVSKPWFENTDDSGLIDALDGDNDNDGIPDSEDDMVEDSDPPGDPDYGIPDWHPKSKHKK